MDDLREAMRARWNAKGRHYEQTGAHGTQSPIEKGQWRSILERLGRSPLDVLDIGTGTGFVALILAGLGHRHLRGSRTDHPDAAIVKSVYYYQFAKAFLAVERDGPWPGPLGSELEIVPQSPAEERLALLVLYEGRPLSGVKVNAFCSGRSCRYAATTDAEGVASFPFGDGNWMFLAGRADPRKGVTGRYDERVLTAVFTLTTTD